MANTASPAPAAAVPVPAAAAAVAPATVAPIAAPGVTPGALAASVAAAGTGPAVPVQPAGPAAPAVSATAAAMAVQSGVATTAGARVIILNALPGLRRAGIVHPARAVHPAAHFTPEQLDEIAAEPAFAVLVIDADDRVVRDTLTGALPTVDGPPIAPRPPSVRRKG